MANRSLREQIYLGNYEAVLRSTVDSGRLPSRETLVPVLAALSNRGRLTEAVSFLDIWEKRLSRSEKIEARFFLGIGYCRHSFYADARRMFSRNLRELSTGRQLSDQESFHVYEGAGFYRYFCGRYRDAIRFAENAFTASLDHDFHYGKIQALDLLGHSLVQTGDISLGLSRMEKAERLARGLGNGGLADGFRIAIAVYRAQFGHDPGTSVARLEQLLSDSRPEDVYSRASLCLELARQYSLRGDLVRTKCLLDQVCPLIYSVKHRRYAAVLNLRYASLHLLTGELAQALNLVRSAGAEIFPGIDRAVETEVRGMEAKILSAMGLRGAEDLERKISKLTRETRRAVSQRILDRGSGRWSDKNWGQDRIADLLDRQRRSSDNAVEEIVAAKLLGLLRDRYRVGSRVIDFLLPGTGAVIYDRGNVSLAGRPPTRAILLFLRALAEGGATRPELVRRVWGYHYAAERHDAALYQLVSRVRRFLGPYSGWLTSTEKGFILNAEVRFREDPEVEPSPAAVAEEKTLLALNFRQLDLIRRLRRVSAWNVESYQRAFRVSAMTARRDLVGLCHQGYLIRIGRARATRYIGRSALTSKQGRRK